MVCLMMENNSCNKSFTSSKKEPLIFVHSSSVLLSTIMCLFACLVVVCLWLHRQIAYWLVLYQILSTLFYSFTKVLTLLLTNFNKENGYYICLYTAKAFLIMYSLWVQQLSTLFVTFHLFVDVVLLKIMQKFKLGYTFTTILLPLFPATIPLVTNSYTESVLVHDAGSESGTITVQLTSMLQESLNSLVSAGGYHCF